MAHKTRCLFICKKRIDSYGISFGLLNSATFVVNALNAHDIESKIVSVVDSNCIDREVSEFKPTHVFIEAIWVTADKFEVLCKLHPKVKFIIRIHSKIPFLAMEGIAIEWIRDYQAVANRFKNLKVSSNNKDFNDDLSNIIKIPSVYLPNIYAPICDEPIESHWTEFEYDNEIPRCLENEPAEINIGCFGAIRPLKNHLIQALAAIQFAEGLNKKLRFHINCNRIEQKGDNILKNLRALFVGTPHELVEHPWMGHPEFIKLVKTMDMGMQVSFTESFNIVAADFVSNRRPIVVSPDVDWVSEASQADPNSTEDIVKKLRRAWRGGMFDLTRINLKALVKHNKQALEIWLDQLL